MVAALKPIHQAYERSKAGRNCLADLGRCVEVIEDRSGILVERYVVNGYSLVLFATPSWWDVYESCAPHTIGVDETLARVRAIAAEER